MVSLFLADFVVVTNYFGNTHKALLWSQEPKHCLPFSDCFQQRGVSHIRKSIPGIMYEKCIIMIAIVPRNYMAVCSWCGPQEGSGQLGLDSHFSIQYRMNPWGGNLYLFCNYCCCWTDYNYPATAPITDIKPAITTLMTIYTIATLVSGQSQHFSIQFYSLAALNEERFWHIPLSPLSLFNVISVQQL